jgi:hypothetical protein
MEQSQYRRFPNHAREGAEVMVMPVGDHDHIGCFTDQVKLTHALVQDLDEAVKEVNLLEEHEEESSQRITELEALCKSVTLLVLLQQLQYTYISSYSTSTVASTVFIQWLLWYKLNSRKMAFSINEVGSFEVYLKV